MWVPQLSEFNQPVYLSIADALARDINSGLLSDGERLPTLRDLAATLNVTPGTISRAYSEAQRRGLVQGEGLDGLGYIDTADGWSRKQQSGLLHFTAETDRIFLMNQGKIVQSGDAETLYTAPVDVFDAGFIGNYNLLDADKAIPAAVKWCSVLR